MLLHLFSLLLLCCIQAMDLRYLRRQVVPTTHTSVQETNCTQPAWGAWFEELACNHNCGACGVKVLRRHCLTPNCPCLGTSRQQLPCNIGVCDHPRPACCPPYKISYYDGLFGCGPQAEDVVAEFANQSRLPSTTPWNPFVTRMIATTEKEELATE